MGKAKTYCAELNKKIEELVKTEKCMVDAISGQWDERFFECFTDSEYIQLQNNIQEALNTLKDSTSKILRYEENEKFRTEFDRLLELRSIMISRDYRTLQLLVAIGAKTDAIERKLFGYRTSSVEKEYFQLITGLRNKVKNETAFERIAGLKRVSKRKSNSSGYMVGEYLKMGNYGGEPIEWLILEADGDKRTMIAVKGQDAVCFNKTGSDGNQWKNSHIRTWLNDTYYNTAFSAEEKAMIAAGPTGDKVWLLSMGEARKYFANDNARVCYPTDHAIKSGAWADDNGAGWWWLRSPGSNSNLAANVYSHGLVIAYGFDVNYGFGMARPVVVVSLGF